MIDKLPHLKPITLTPIILVLVVTVTFGQIKKVKVTINSLQAHQTIEGFGIFLPDNHEFLPDYDSTLFTFTKEAKISLVGFSIPPDLEIINDDENPDHFNWPKYNMQTFEKQLRVVQQLKTGGVVNLFAVNGSIPEFVVTNPLHKVKAPIRADKFNEYAESVAAFVIGCKNHLGLDIKYIGIDHHSFNDKNSFGLNPQQTREGYRAVGKKFSQEGIKTRFFTTAELNLPTEGISAADAVLRDSTLYRLQDFLLLPAQLSREDILKWKAPTVKYEKNKWILDKSLNHSTWESMITSACNIQHHLIDGDINAWIKLVGHEAKSIKNGNNLSQADKLLIHFSKFIRPGAHRVGTSADNENIVVSAYNHPTEGTQTILMINKSLSATEINLVFNKGSKTPSAYQMYQSTEKEWLVEKSIKKKKKTKILLPPNSIVTLYGGYPGKTSKESTENVPVWKAPEKIKISSAEHLSLASEKKDRLEKIITQGTLQDLQTYLKKNKINAVTANGWSALHWAVYAGNYQAAELLIKRKADINKADSAGLTPFHIAAAMPLGSNIISNKSSFQLFKFLLAKKPNLSATTKERFTPLHLAVINAYSTQDSMEVETINRVKDIIKAKADLEANDYEGRTPLHWAAWQGYQIINSPAVSAEVVQILLKAGARVNASDVTGKTPLHYAVEMGNLQVVLTLILAGADITLEDNWGKTPYDAASERGLTDILEIMEAETGDNPEP